MTEDVLRTVLLPPYIWSQYSSPPTNNQIFVGIEQLKVQSMRYLFIFLLEVITG